MDKIAVFIDGSNLYHSLKGEFSRTDLDFEKFYHKLVGTRQLVRVYYYNAAVDQSKEPQRYKDQQRFFARMRRLPYLQLCLGRLIYKNWPSTPPYEKGIDIKMATDMLIHAFRGNYEIAVLVSGDNDFVDAIQAVKDLGKHVEVALFGSGSSSQQLRDVGDKTITLDDRFLTDCWK